MSSTKIVLTSSDGETFTVEEAVARQMQTVAHMIEDDCADKPIPLQNVTGKVLGKVIEYCKTQVDSAAEAEDDEGKKKLVTADGEEAKKKFGVWDAELMNNFDINMIFKLMLAANYLYVKGLLGLTCQAVADYIKDKSVDEVRKLFNVEGDFTPEEEEAFRKEHAYAFQNSKP